MSSSYPSPPNTPSRARVGIDRELARQAKRSPARASNHAPLTPPTSPPTAPSKNGSITAVKAMAVAAPMDPTVLKKRLGLDIGNCGSNTLKKLPCRIANPSNIERQIMSMTTLTQGHHIKPVPKAARIKDWKKVFPVGDEKAVPIEPIEDQIKSVLDCFPYTSEYTCVGVKRDGMQCGNKIGGKWIRRGKKTVALILKPEHYSHHHNLTFLLNVLASNMFCHRHKKQIPDQVAEWESRITTIYRAYHMQIQPLRSTGNTRSSRYFQGNPAEFWDDADDTSAFVTKIETNRPSDSKACYSLVRDKMKEPLKKEELDPGYVYVYEVEGNKGFVKIGFTTQTIEERSKQWKFQCDRVPKVLYPLGPAEKIQHANRVEALCLAELKYRNVIVVCEACPKQHIEWVNVPATEAIAVIQKWTKWINTTPFKDLKRPLTRWQLANEITSWTLRDEEVRRTVDMPKFMQEVAAASSSAGHQRSRRKASAATSAGNLGPKRKEVSAAVLVGNQSLRREIAVAPPSAGHQRSRKEISAAVLVGNQSLRREIAVAPPSAGHRRSKKEISAATSAGNLGPKRKEVSTAMLVGNQSLRREIAVASPLAEHQHSRREAPAAVSVGSLGPKKNNVVSSSRVKRMLSKIFDH